MPTQQQIHTKAEALRSALRQEARYLGRDDGNYRVLCDMADADDNSLARLYDLIQKHGTKGKALAELERERQSVGDLIDEDVAQAQRAGRHYLDPK